MSANRSNYFEPNKDLYFNLDFDADDVTSASEGVRGWRESVPSTSTLSPDDTSSDTESSFRYTAGSTDASFERSGLPRLGEPRYLYYRVYTKDCAIPCKIPVNLYVPYLARILVGSVPPPHTVSSLKRCLSKAEGITNHESSSLFSGISSQSAMDDSNRLSLLSDLGPWSTPQEPLVLVGKLSLSEEAAVPTRFRISPESSGARYLYYRIYTVDGAITSKQTAISSDPSLGRVNTILIAPPHTAISVKRCLCHFEKIGNHENTSLFITASCKSPMKDADQVSILNVDAGPGVMPSEPMALVVTLPDQDRLFYNAKSVRGSSVYDTRSINPRYLYYKIYNEDSEIQSARSVASPQSQNTLQKESEKAIEDLSLGCIDARFVAPPHSAASLKRCISNAERFTYCVEDKLFLDISSESPMDDEITISILLNEGPGVTANIPMALVRPAFYQRAQVKRQLISTGGKYLSVEVNEIINIHGPAEKLSWFTKGYNGINALGSKGFVAEDNIDLIAC